MEEVLPWAILRQIWLKQSSVTSDFKFHVCFKILIVLIHEVYNNSCYTVELMYNCACKCHLRLLYLLRLYKSLLQKEKVPELWKCENTTLGNKEIFKGSQSDLRKFTGPDAWWIWFDRKWLQDRAWPTACGPEPAPNPRTVLFDLSQDFWTRCAETARETEETLILVWFTNDCRWQERSHSWS